MTLNIEKAWQAVTPSLRSEILDFWETNRMLPAGIDPQERALEAALVVRNPGGAIAGVTTAGVVRFKQLSNKLFYLFRMAVLPAFRIPGIESKLIVETRNLLEAYAVLQQSERCIGMLTFVENPRLIANRNEAIWPASKMVYIGSDSSGRHIRVYYFAGARI